MVYVFRLVPQDDWAKARTALKLDDRMGVIQARDLSKHVIKSAADGLDLVRRATANRRVSTTVPQAVGAG